MRRSTLVYAPILAAAALTLPIGYRTAAQQSSVTAEQAGPTAREGFGASFRHHPWEWLLGTTWAGFMVFGSGS